MKNIIALLLLSLTFLTGCDSGVMYDSMINKLAAEFSNEVDLSKKYLAMMQAHDFATIEDKIDPRLKDGQLQGNLEKVAAFFPAEKPTDIKLIGLNRNVFSNGSGTTATTSITYEYQFPNKWLQASVVLQSKDNNMVIAGINVIPLPDSLENINKFTLSGKSLLSYMVLTFACVVPLFIIGTLIVCARTPIQKRKWLWIIFVLFGFVSVQFNWTDGSAHINPLYFNLLGAGFARSSPFSPVILGVSIPLGAIVFWMRRKKLIGQK